MGFSRTKPMPEGQLLGRVKSLDTLYQFLQSRRTRWSGRCKADPRKTIDLPRLTGSYVSTMFSALQGLSAYIRKRTSWSIWDISAAIAADAPLGSLGQCPDVGIVNSPGLHYVVMFDLLGHRLWNTSRYRQAPMHRSKQCAIRNQRTRLLLTVGARPQVEYVHAWFRMTSRRSHLGNRCIGTERRRSVEIIASCNPSVISNLLIDPDSPPCM